MLRIEIVKRADGAGVLRCARSDGSITWQKQTRHAAHFAVHDLTHYAVETVLGCRRGFFGLIAEGWDVEETGGKAARGAVPPEAVEVERIVGLFDAERGVGAHWTAEEFNEFAPRALTSGGDSGYTRGPRQTVQGLGRGSPGGEAGIGIRGCFWEVA
jgi:hypothetical protein